MQKLVKKLVLIKVMRIVSISCELLKTVGLLAVRLVLP